MTEPLVTIVIPVYNYADKVGRAISSVASQTMNNFECFIIDDGSTDGTRKAVEEHIKYDARFHYVHQKNAGVAVARNRGIALGTAPFVCCLDADDSIEPLFLEACLDTLLKDRSVHIAYTKLRYILPDGKTGVSRWPDNYDFDKQLKGSNQVPTCCVFTRIMWERLGGYRARYCPHGAGSEDAEFWLRAGAHGYGAKLATEAPLFVYSYLSGNVSGNKDYTEINWLGGHPWTSGADQPFASLAKPRRQSHPVHQYDNPTVSIIIPVGPLHRAAVFDALDSLESQSYPYWEAIVVDDSGDNSPLEFDGFPDPWRAYPYVRRYTTKGKQGAGAARNIGVQHARGGLVLFLDADDMLMPECLEEMIAAWNAFGEIVYTDYGGKIDSLDGYMVDGTLQKDIEERILYHDEKSGIAVLRHNSSDFDCAQAQAQPNKSLYIWNLVTSLVPRAWHDEIGGFDENMPSWEDWDYWIRMARAGKCFYHIRKPLIVYRFYTGDRRERGGQEYENLIEYMRKKYEATNTMSPCNCRDKNKSRPAVQQVVRSQPAQKLEATNMVDDNSVVLILYNHQNRGQHKVIGAATRRNYGYHGGGDRFYVDRRDVAAMPGLFVPIERVVQTPDVPRSTTPPPQAKTKAPEVVERHQQTTAPVVDDDSAGPLDGVDQKTLEIESPDIVLTLDQVPGVSPSVRAQLNSINVFTVEELAVLNVTDLLGVKGVGANRAKAMLAFAKDYVAKRKD